MRLPLSLQLFAVLCILLFCTSVSTNLDALQMLLKNVVSAWHTNQPSTHMHQSFVTKAINCQINAYRLAHRSKGKNLGLRLPI